MNNLDWVPGAVIENSLVLGAIDLNTLPEDMTFKQHLDLDGCTGLKLPNGLTVLGSLRLSRCNDLHLLPSCLRVGGGLSISDCPNILEIADSVQWGGDLFVQRCRQLIKIPALASYPGSLHLSEVSSSFRLPSSFMEGLRVAGSLEIEKIYNTWWPRRFAVGKSLVLRGCNIGALPDDLTVPVHLDLRGCEYIKGLPTGLTVGGDLNIQDTEIIEMPDDLQIGGRVRADPLPVIKHLSKAVRIDPNAAILEARTLLGIDFLAAEQLILEIQGAAQSSHRQRLELKRYSQPPETERCVKSVLIENDLDIRLFPPHRQDWFLRLLGKSYSTICWEHVEGFKKRGSAYWEERDYRKRLSHFVSGMKEGGVVPDFLENIRIAIDPDDIDIRRGSNLAAAEMINSFPREDIKEILEDALAVESTIWETFPAWYGQIHYFERVKEAAAKWLPLLRAIDDEPQTKRN